MKAASSPAPIPLNPADFGPRLGALIIDAVVIFIGLVILGIIFYAAGPFTSNVTVNVLAWLGSAAYWTFGYSTVMGGQTLGKRA